MKYKIRLKASQPSHRKLLSKLGFASKRILVRIGNSKPVKRNYDLVINSKEGIDIAKNKILMKKYFKSLEINSPDFYLFENRTLPVVQSFPVYMKRQFRSRGIGMLYIQNQEELESAFNKHVLNNNYFLKNNYYLETKNNFTREYGIHVSTSSGIFHAVRKMLKSNAENRYFRNSNNCVFYLEENLQFNKPSCWDEIESVCLRYLNETGLDIGRFDIKVSKDGTRYSIIEINSGMSLEKETIFIKYLNEINLLCAE